MLRDYVQELQKRNPNTTVVMNVERPADEALPTREFKRVYVCLGALKEGFKACGRSLLGLDAFPIRGPLNGQLMTAVGIDSNNGIYPLAYAFAESENIGSWTWFLHCLSDDITLEPISSITFITDMQKDISGALRDVFPDAEHRFCIRSIHEKMKLQWKGRAYKEHLWKFATASTIVHFQKAMADFKKFNQPAHDWLSKIPPIHWSRSHFSWRANYDVLLNNMCQVFHDKIIEGLNKPIITALEYIREYCMKRIIHVLMVIEKSDGPLTPTAQHMLEGIKKEAVKYNVLWNGGTKFQIGNVDLEPEKSWVATQQLSVG